MRIICRLFFTLLCIGLNFCAGQTDLIGTPGPDYAPLPNGKAPFRMIYSNDTTHIMTSPSPYRPTSDMGLTDDMIAGSVKEAAVGNMGAQMIQPGTGWTAWWNSKKFSMDHQFEWFEKHFGKNGRFGPYAEYWSMGGDIVKAFIEACRKEGQAAFVSYRLNDLHHLREAFNGDKINPSRAIYLSEFYVTHPEYKRGPGLGVAHLGHNWLIEQARNHKFEMIDELVRTYDLDGLELDFLRAPMFFPYEPASVKTTAIPMEQRVAVMTDFISKVRASIDQSARNGRKRWLSVRVPAEKTDWINVGFDPVAWRKAGVDIFNLSPSYCTTQQTDVAEVRRLVPDATIYVELTHCAHRWKIDAKQKKLGENYRRSGFVILENAARTAYARGADGVSFFNFMYYRGPYNADPRNAGQGAEPPFHYLPALASPVSLTAPLYYFYAPDDRFPNWEQKISAQDKDAFVFKMDTVTPPNKEGVFRMQLVSDDEKMLREFDIVDESLDRGQWEVLINGRRLKEIPNDPDWGVYPFEEDFPGGLGEPCQYRAWRVPAGLLRDGKNEVSIRMRKGDHPMWLRWSEIFYPDSK